MPTRSRKHRKPSRYRGSRINSRSCRMPPARATERAPLRSILAALLIASVLPLSSCIYVQYPAGPETPTPIPGFDAQKFEVDKLTAALSRREKSLDTMQTQAIMEYTGADQKV